MPILEDALDRAERALFDVSQRRATRDFQSDRRSAGRFFDQIDYLQQNRGEIVGVPTGFTDLDKLTGGLQRSDLIIVAARPSVGKTAFALGIAYGAARAARQDGRSFRLEMSAEQLVQRLLSTETGVDSHRLRLGQIDDNEWDRISRAFGRLAEAKIFIDDSAGRQHHGCPQQGAPAAGRAWPRSAHHRLPAADVRAAAARTACRKSREISRGLKGLARELNVPVIALSQLSRAVETRADHRPMLSDLRESGSIEQDADIVMFIYREEIYDPDTERKGIAEIIVAKHRNGPVDIDQPALLRSHGPLCRSRALSRASGQLETSSHVDELLDGVIVDTERNGLGIPAFLPHRYCSGDDRHRRDQAFLAAARLVVDAGSLDTPIEEPLIVRDRSLRHALRVVGSPQ